MVMQDNIITENATEVYRMLGLAKCDELLYIISVNTLQNDVHQGERISFGAHIFLTDMYTTLPNIGRITDQKISTCDLHGTNI